MTNVAVLRPFRERDFAQHLGPDPVDRAEFAGARAAQCLALQYRLVGRERLKPLPERMGALHGEARADLPGVGQFAAATAAEIVVPSARPPPPASLSPITTNSCRCRHFAFSRFFSRPAV